MKKQITYADSGVDIDKADKLIDFIGKAVKKTYSKNVLAGIGGFSAAFAFPKGYKNPLLISCTDGVGTKLKIAFALNRHSTIGIDLVAMSINDLATCGAKPLFFLDYFATGKLELRQAKEVINGIIKGCRMSDCALIGGETAEMPDFYPKGEYDLSGFAVGVVDKSKIINGRRIKSGDTIIGLGSSGLHSNGFSLVRKLIKKNEWRKYSSLLLPPTKIYSRLILELVKKYDVKGIAHITGGGLLENTPRILPKGTKAVIKKGTWPVHKIFGILQERGSIPEKEIFRTFNMGIGMVLVVPKTQAVSILKFAKKYHSAYIIGRIEKGNQLVELI